MSSIKWGTVRKVLREAEIALASSNPSGKRQQMLGVQKLHKATAYINEVGRATTKDPRRFAEADVVRLQGLIRCLREKKLTARKQKENLAGYLQEGALTIRALRDTLEGRAA